MSTPNENFAKRVTSYREKLGITQSELANRLGVSRNYVGMLEAGREPSEPLKRLFQGLEEEATRYVVTVIEPGGAVPPDVPMVETLRDEPHRNIPLVSSTPPMIRSMPPPSNANDVIHELQELLADFESASASTRRRLLPHIEELTAALRATVDVAPNKAPAQQRR